MRECVDIVYNDVLLSEENGIQINDSSGLFNETFVATKSIREEKIRGNDEPYFFGVEREPISFPLSFYFDEKLSDDRKREIARILDQDYYKPLYAKNNPQRIYYAMCVDSSQHIHNGIQMGYMTLNFRTSSPYAFSPVYYKYYDFRDNTVSGEEFIFINNGDVECKPVIELTAFEEGNFIIENHSESGEELILTGLKNGEIVTIDCIQETITSTVTERYNDFNNNYLSFVPYSKNYIKVYGKCVIKLKYQFKLK